jgi:hypothetical protein
VNDPSQDMLTAAGAHHPARLLLTALVVLTCVVALVSMARVMSKGGVGVDFYSYWYAGHFLWQGQDPYPASLQGTRIDSSVQYLDRPQGVKDPAVELGDRGVAANTAPFVLFLSLFSRVTWPTALGAWRIFNLVLAGLVGWMLTADELAAPALGKRVFVMAILFSLIATREIVEYGQTTILALALMVAAMRTSRSPVVCGLLLGLALSKYSLVFPLFIVLALYRRFTILTVAIGVQVAGVLGLAALTHAPPLEIISSYVRILRLHAGLEGMHLTGSILQGTGLWGDAVVGLVSIGLTVLLLRWYLIWRRGSRQCEGLAQYALVTTLMIWNLAVFYHPRYDDAAVILLIAMVILYAHEPVDSDMARERGFFGLSLQEEWTLLSVLGLLCLVWILPAYGVIGPTWYRNIFSLSNLLALALSVWLLFKLAARYAPQPGPAPRP